MYVLHSKASQTFQNINLMNETTLKCMKIFTKSLKNLHFNERTNTQYKNNNKTPNKSFNVAETVTKEPKKIYNIISKF